LNYDRNKYTLVASTRIGAFFIDNTTGIITIDTNGYTNADSILTLNNLNGYYDENT
jgi:hypothetical protein